MRIAVVLTGNGGAQFQALAHDGQPLSAVEHHPNAIAAIVEKERQHAPRWVWASTSEIYPRLLAAGVTVRRCHDVELCEALLLGYDGRWGEPRTLPAAWARLIGAPVPPDQPTRPRDQQPALFDPALFNGVSSGPFSAPDQLSTLVAVHAAQQAWIGHTEHPDRFALLVAAESAGALVAAEMGHLGLPWRADVHHELLVDLLGPRPAPGMPPQRLGVLAKAIGEALGDPQLHPDSPAELVRAFAKVGIAVPSTRSWVLRKVDHPAVPLLLTYKELYRIYTAHGWHWLSTWVHNGRFRPEYVVGGVVSGRWATNGGGALQIHHKLRRAVIADPGWVLVVADAGQLEPRVLAAIAQDAQLALAGQQGDLYRALADEAFQGDRARAKIGMLAALYGQTSGEGAQLVTALRRKFPRAVDYVEQAAQVGETGGLVRSWLGRTCLPASAEWKGDHDPENEQLSTASTRARGRFTRNFVVQASAAEWALALLAILRNALAEIGSASARPELVFFQHDEVIVHCRAEDAPKVSTTLKASAVAAGQLVFGDIPVRFPMEISVVDCYADAKSKTESKVEHAEAVV